MSIVESLYISLTDPTKGARYVPETDVHSPVTLRDGVVVNVLTVAIDGEPPAEEYRYVGPFAGPASNPRIFDLTMTINLDRLANPERARAEVENLTYRLAQALFETGGEYNTRPDGSRVMGGNGHCAAQEEAAMVGEYWAGRVTR